MTNSNSYVDQHKDRYVARLSDAVSIASVSGEPERRGEVVRMVEWTKDVRFALSSHHAPGGLRK